MVKVADPDSDSREGEHGSILSSSCPEDSGEEAGGSDRGSGVVPTEQGPRDPLRRKATRRKVRPREKDASWWQHEGLD